MSPAPTSLGSSRPDWALDAAAEKGRQSVDVIRALGVTVLGDLDALAIRVPSSPPVPADAESMLPVDAGVQAVMTVIAAAREESVTSRELAGQLWRRTRQQGREKLRRGSPTA